MRTFWASLTSGQRRTLGMMAAVVGGLHLLGVALLLLFAAPAHPGLAGAGSLSIGLGVTAYTLGLRHAFDADHISAIDNTTRTLMAQGRRPLSVGFWFSLGHSTVVFALSAALAAGMRAIIGPVSHRGSLLHRTSSLIGTGISGGFLFLIAAVNIVILLEVVKVFLAMRTGRYDEAALEDRLRERGLMNRVFGRFTARISRPAQMYPIGVLFGLGFDTATEVALLIIAGSAGAAGMPWYAMLCLPLLFAAGMSLMDSIDGSLMHFAYGWAFTRPVRRVFYNMTVTGLSVAVALVIATIELGGLAGSELNLSGRFWNWLENIDINQLGFFIVGLFVTTWIVALAVWRWGRIEQRWLSAPGDVGRAR
jgi:high-affinity nickel-transport protein